MKTEPSQETKLKRWKRRLTAWQDLPLVSIFIKLVKLVKPDTVSIAVLFFVVIWLVFVLQGCMAKSPVVRGLSAPKPVEWVRIDNLGKIQSLELKRVNLRNGATEILKLQEEEVQLWRSVGNFSRFLDLGTEALDRLSAEFLKLGRVAIYEWKGVEELQIVLSVIGKEGNKTLSLDPTGSLQPIYSELMAIRERVLKYGK